jgi:hypothetical protein
LSRGSRARSPRVRSRSSIERHAEYGSSPDAGGALEDILDAAWLNAKDEVPGDLDDFHEALFKTGLMVALQILAEAADHPLVASAFLDSLSPDGRGALKKLTDVAWTRVGIELLHEALAPAGLESMHATLFAAGFGSAFPIVAEHIDHPLTARALQESLELEPLDLVRVSLGLPAGHRRVGKRSSRRLS